MDNKKLIRVFLAVELPQKIKNQIKDIQQRLDPLLKGVRWTRPEGIHLTLKFFGNISKDEIIRITKAVEQNTQDVAPMTLHIKRVGGFPGLSKPRVMWLGIDGKVQELINLQESIEKNLKTSGFSEEKRPFKPHLTIGRAKSSRGNIFGLQELLKGREQFETGSFDVMGLTLLKSDLKPERALYTKLAYLPLRG